jgi:hypothetical protein
MKISSKCVLEGSVSQLVGRVLLVWLNSRLGGTTSLKNIPYINNNIKMYVIVIIYLFEMEKCLFYKGGNMLFDKMTGGTQDAKRWDWFYLEIQNFIYCVYKMFYILHIRK